MTKRERIIEKLKTTDPNGCYDDDDARAEFGRVWTVSELTAMAARIESEVGE